MINVLFVHIEFCRIKKRLSITGSSNFKPSRSSTNFRTSSNNRNSSPPKAETNDDITPRPNLAIKKFNRFKRPDLRQSLLEKILSKVRLENQLWPMAHAE